MVELVVADIDGTLREHIEGNNAELGHLTKQAFQILHKKGVILAIASGRPLWQELQQHASDWNLDFQFDLIIGMNGGQIFDTRKDTKKEINPLTCEQLEMIVHTLHDYQLNPFVYRDGYSLTLHMDKEMEESNKRHNTIARVCRDESELYEIPTCKILYRTPDEQIALEIEEKGKELGNGISCFRTGPTLVEFQSVKNNKGVALKSYCDENGISLENTIAFGDAENDIELLQMAGKGVAVQNALEPVKKIADDITTQRAGRDGVGIYLYETILGEE